MAYTHYHADHDFHEDCEGCLEEGMTGEEVPYDIGTCQGCGAYGQLGKTHVRFDREEGRNTDCGEYL